MATISNNLRHHEADDKENQQKGIIPYKKEKANGEETQVKKSVLGETSQPKIFTEDEDNEIEDTKLYNRKR